MLLFYIIALARVVLSQKIIHDSFQGDSSSTKQCPPGFCFAGKECAKVLTASPKMVCPYGSSLREDACYTYLQKASECPPAYNLSDGLCLNQKRSSPNLECPRGFSLSGEKSCVMKIAQPDQALCPAGTLTRGDSCFRSTLEVPEFVCPDKFVLIGSKCQREEIFDCTPARLDAKENEETPKKFEVREGGNMNKKLRQLPENHKTDTVAVEEYIVKKTCKRIVSEARKAICPSGKSFDGQMCSVEVLVDPIIKHGGYKEDIVPAIEVCPNGYSLTFPGECNAIQAMSPMTFCPPGSVPSQGRCEIRSKPHLECPEYFSLDNYKNCLRTIFAAPIIEYKVSYQCIGKDCQEK